MTKKQKVIYVGLPAAFDLPANFAAKISTESANFRLKSTMAQEFDGFDNNNKAMQNESNIADNAFQKASSNQSDEADQKETKITKPGKARKVNLYLVDPDRFVIEWMSPKQLGMLLPIHYDIIINDHSFEKAVTQTTKSQNKFRVLVYNCDHNEQFKVCVDTHNDAIKGKQGSYYRIKTPLKPSVIRDLSMNDGIITFKPPIYSSFGNLTYELIDSSDTEEKTILVTTDTTINIDEYYKEQDVKDFADKSWRIRIKEGKQQNFSYSPVIQYSQVLVHAYIDQFKYIDTLIRCGKYTMCEVYLSKSIRRQFG